MYSHGPLAPSKGGRHPSSSLHSSNYQIVKNDFFINEIENKVKLSTKYNIKKLKLSIITKIKLTDSKMTGYFRYLKLFMVKHDPCRV